MKNKNLKLAVVSGKGGVGKSMLCSSLAMLFSKEKKIIAVDCDVDAPNLAIWLNETEHWQRVVPVCCDDKPKSERIGEIKTKTTKYGFNLVLGRLYIGQGDSGRVVNEARKEAEKFENELQIIDSSPGTSAPVIAAVKDTNFAVLVTEPTPSGLSDVNRAVEIVRYLKVPWALVINKWDINKPGSDVIEKWAGDKLIGKISYDVGVIEAAARLSPVMETDLGVAEEMKLVYNKLKGLLHDNLSS